MQFLIKVQGKNTLVICIIKPDTNALKLILYLFLLDLLHFGSKENLIIIIKLIFGCIFIVIFYLFIDFLIYYIIIIISSQNFRPINFSLFMHSRNYYFLFQSNNLEI